MENQVHELGQIAERRGWRIVADYCDTEFPAPKAAPIVLASIGS